LQDTESGDDLKALMFFKLRRNKLPKTFSLYSHVWC